jgi:hypothetical protein
MRSCYAISAREVYKEAFFVIYYSRDDIDIATATDQSCCEQSFALYPPNVSAKVPLILFKYEPVVVDNSVFYNSK